MVGSANGIYNIYIYNNIYIVNDSNFRAEKKVSDTPSLRGLLRFLVILGGSKSNVHNLKDVPPGVSA